MEKSQKKKMRYDASFRLKVEDLAKRTNNSEAARQYGINENLGHEWRKTKTVLRKMLSVVICTFVERLPGLGDNFVVELT